MEWTNEKLKKITLNEQKMDKRLNWTFLLTRSQLRLSVVVFLLDLHQRCFDSFNHRMCDDRYRNICANHLLLQTWNISILGAVSPWFTFIVEQFCFTLKFFCISIVLFRIVSIMEHHFRAIWMQNNFFFTNSERLALLDK